MSDTATPTERWTAAHCRVAARLFAVCGEAGASGTSAGVALALTSLAGQLAWHEALLFDLLPIRAGTDAASLVAAPARGADDALEMLDALASCDDAPMLCVVLARVVVPRLHAAVADARARTDARIDGPRARALTLVARDLLDAIVVLEPIAERVVADPGAFERAAKHCADVERSLVTAGVGLGVVAR